MNELFRRDALTRCPACEYDLQGATGAVCPECGHTVSEAGMPLDQRPRASVNLALRIALGPQAVALLLVAVPVGLMWLCDRLAPGWEYSFTR